VIRPGPFNILELSSFILKRFFPEIKVSLIYAMRAPSAFARVTGRSWLRQRLFVTFRLLVLENPEGLFSIPAALVFTMAD